MKKWILLFGLLAAQFAQAEIKFGDWTVVVDDSYVVAAVKNESEYAFGLLCNQETCVGFVNPQMSCNDNATIPMMVNGGGGAANLDVKCFIYKSKSGPRYLMTFDDALVIDALKEGDSIAFAFPGSKSNIKVARFSTTGAMKALKAALTATQRKGKFKDQTL